MVVIYAEFVERARSKCPYTTHDPLSERQTPRTMGAGRLERCKSLEGSNEASSNVSKKLTKVARASRGSSKGPLAQRHRVCCRLLLQFDAVPRNWRLGRGQ